MLIVFEGDYSKYCSSLLERKAYKRERRTMKGRDFEGLGSQKRLQHSAIYKSYTCSTWYSGVIRVWLFGSYCNGYSSICRGHYNSVLCVPNKNEVKWRGIFQRRPDNGINADVSLLRILLRGEPQNRLSDGDTYTTIHFVQFVCDRLHSTNKWKSLCVCKDSLVAGGRIL